LRLFFSGNIKYKNNYPKLSRKEEYIKFYTKFYSRQKIYFINDNFNSKKSPYYYGNYLYFPVEYCIQKKKPIGLNNIGGVCYMNALLQCFYYCHPMTKYFLQLDFDKKEKLGLVSKGYYDFVHGLNSGDQNAAYNFKNALLYTNNAFAGGGKDSKDLALFILLELHDELKNGEQSIICKMKEEDNYKMLTVYEEKIKSEQRERNSTIISDTFEFNIILDQKCLNPNCNNIYTNNYFTIQSENILIFDLETIYKESNKINTKLSLDDCFSYYIRKQIIKCPFCLKKSLEVKKNICSLPKIFIFVMSRGKYCKFDCEIDIKKEIAINMKKYYTPPGKKYEIKDAIYDLICCTIVYDWCKVYSHAGHTVAFCKIDKEGSYYIFNDSRCSPSSLKDLDDKIPYILFYERRDK
jgi:ubiquitin C-terminal hydrolase